MADRTGTSDERLLDYLRLARVGGHRKVEGGGVEPGLLRLRAWQSERLARTHADLLAHPRYGPACQFFLSDVYGARDFSQRDHDVVRVYESMHALLPPSLRRALELAIVLNALTLDLDEKLLGALEEQPDAEGAITVGRYAAAYRRCDNYADRVRQIDLLVEVGRQIDLLVHKPAVGLALRLARIPARIAGWHEHQDFLERGFAAFKRMNGADEFLATLAGRERSVLDRIYAGAPDPFEGYFAPPEITGFL